MPTFTKLQCSGCGKRFEHVQTGPGRHPQRCLKCRAAAAIQGRRKAAPTAGKTGSKNRKEQA